MKKHPQFFRKEIQLWSLSVQLVPVKDSDEMSRFAAKK